jgi:chaperone required for assembly of F1-ATPase
VKRFYKSVGVQQRGAMFAVTLDTRPIKTPGGEIMVLRAPGLADTIAAEWARQEGEFELESLHLTRLAYGAVEGEPLRAKIVAEVVKFAGSDLTCYRATEPKELVDRQAAAWDPPLLWVRSRYAIALNTTTGLAHIEQPADAIAALEHALSSKDMYALVALHAATGILGSAVLALNLADARLDATSAFAAAHVDEIYQAERWGEDHEARKRLDRLAAELASAEQFLRLL